MESAPARGRCALGSHPSPNPTILAEPRGNGTRGPRRFTRTGRDSAVSPRTGARRHVIEHSRTAGALGLPDLSAPYVVTDEQVDRYRNDGYVVLEAFLSSAELEAYAPRIRAEAMRLLAEDGMETTFGGAFHQRLNLRFHSEVLKAYCLCPRLGSVGAQLAGARAMRIYHEQVLFKPPGANASYWHQDMYFWPLETERSLGTWMPLTDVTEEMGALRYAKGSHRLGDLGQHSIDEASEAFFDAQISEHGLEAVQLESIRAGDLCVHNGWMVHGASANRSARMREAVVVAMYPDGTRVAPLVNDYRRSDAENFLGGREVGEIADSELNTILS